MKRTIFWLGTAASTLALAPVALFAQSSNRVTTTGDGNSVSVDQVNATIAQVEIDQIGDGNIMNVVQSGSDDRLTALTDGISLTQNIRQSGNSANSADIVSTGIANGIDLQQDGLAGGSNIASLIQMGIGNQAVIDQMAIGGINSIALTQNGNNNLADLTQNGADNAIDLTQNGDDNGAVVTQNGNGLGFALTQTGGAQIVVTQTSPGG